jgi:hypothetical protein
MTETRNFEQIFNWKWDKEQIQEEVRKNKKIQKIRRDLLKSRSRRFFKEKEIKRRN